MSTLTKMFIVLLVVFSIAFTTMTISIVAQTANWQETAKKYEQHARVADTNLQNLIAANAAELATAYDAVKSHLKRIAGLESQLQARAGDLAQVRAELSRAASEKSSSEAINRGLLAQLQSADAARAEYVKQRDELEHRNIDLERRNIDLNDRVNELTAQVSVMLEQKRQFEQQINILRTENEKLAQQTRTMSSGMAMEAPSAIGVSHVVARTPVAPAAIRGRIQNLNGNIVTISVGASDGVKEGMIFVVHRGDEYVGDLQISLVDPDESAGRPIGANYTPLVGDEVTDALGLASSRG